MIDKKDIEHILIRNLIENNDYFGKVKGILNKKHFSNIGNSEIYNIITEYYREYGDTPGVTEIITSAKNIPNPQMREDIANNLRGIISKEPVKSTDFLVDETVKFVKDAIFTEGLILGADAITKGKDEDKAKALDLIEQSQKLQIDTELGMSFEDIEERIAYYHDTTAGIYTRIESINKRIGKGFLPGTLSVFMAPPGIGKSLLICELASDWMLQKKNVLFISMEMSDVETFKRIDANVLDLPINNFNGLLKSEIIERFNEVKARGVGKLYIKQYGPGVFSADDLESLLDAYDLEHGIKFDAIMLDYLGIMRSTRVSKGSTNSYDYIKNIGEEVRALAIKHQIPIITASQLNRNAQNNLEANNESISDSMGTAMTADFIMFLLQTPEMKAQNKYLFRITKNRLGGWTDAFEINIDYTRMRFSESIVHSSVGNIQTGLEGLMRETDKSGLDEVQVDKFLEDLL